MGLLLRGIDRIRVDFRALDIGCFSAFPGDMAAVDAFHLVVREGLVREGRFFLDQFLDEMKGNEE